MKRYSAVLDKLALLFTERRAVAIVKNVGWDTLRERYLRWALKQTSDPCKALPCVSFRGNFTQVRAGAPLSESISRALKDVGGLSNFVLAIDGMSGRKYRTFINEFIRSHPGPRYLEIGSWQGSTAAAALSGNSVQAVCIDNWSQFGGPKSRFLSNMRRVIAESPAAHFDIIENDFRKVDYKSLGQYNVFLFDGPHEEQDQYDGVMIARPALESPFVLIVDDWNWRRVRLGTFRAIRDAGYSIVCSVEIRTTQNDTVPEVQGSRSDWHNGYFIGVLEKC